MASDLDDPLHVGVDEVSCTPGWLGRICTTLAECLLFIVRYILAQLLDEFDDMMLADGAAGPDAGDEENDEDMETAEQEAAAYGGDQ